MAGLGEGMENGEPGMVTTPPQTDVQAIPSKKGEIAHTTAVEDISFLLYRDYIFLAEYTIDSTMLPGHVFAILPIHPSKCNPYVDYFSRPFNAWNGTMGIRTRFMANAFNGGSFRIGWLPPNLLPEEIRTMPLSSLTAYPNRDLDPKNTDWMHYMANDERNVMFHWMTNEVQYDKPESFGGYIVMYVVGSLVVGQAQIGSVSMVVEAVGNFTFRQPSPRFKNIAPTTEGPLHDYARIGLSYAQGCDDFLASVTNTIQIQPVADRDLTTGYVYAKSMGGKDPWSFGGTMNERLLQFKGTNGMILSSVPAAVVMEGSTFPIVKTDAFAQRIPISLPFNVEYDAVGASTSLFKVAAGGSVEFFDFTPDKRELSNEAEYFMRSVSVSNPGVLFRSYCRAFLTGDRGTRAVDMKKCEIRNATYKLPNPQGKESIVTFCNGWIGTMNMQTRPISDSLSVSVLDKNTSYLYAVRTELSPEKIRILRLNPNGMFTTQAEDKLTIIETPIGDSVYLTYEGTLPVDSPLPPRSSFARHFAKKSQRYLEQGVLSQKCDKLY